MRKNGVSTGAALAFWLGNPTLNPATLVFILFALSWKWALLRLIVGLVLVFGVSALVGSRYGSKNEEIDASTLVPAEPDALAPVVVRWFQNLGKLIIGLIPEYLVIVLALGAARAWLFPVASLAAGNSLLVIVALAIAGTIFVIPTAGEIPIVQTMLHFGLGIGPAGALLMTLGPISVPSIAMVSTVFPKQVLAATTGAVVLVGIISGIAALALGF